MTLRSESDIQAEILSALHAVGLTAFRIPAGTFKRGSRYIKSVNKGWPDIIVLGPPTGRMIGLEVKREEGGLVGEAQVVMKAVFEASGAAYEFVRSVEETREALRKHGIIIG